QAGLRQRIRTTEERPGLSADCGAEVVDLQEVAVDIVDVDARTVELDVWVSTAHWIANDERSLRSDSLEAASRGQVEATMELAEHVARELQNAGEADVHPGRTRPLPPEGKFRLSRQQPLHADAVAAEVHQSPAVQLGQPTDIRVVGERPREQRPHLSELPDRDVA